MNLLAFAHFAHRRPRLIVVSCGILLALSVAMLVYGGRLSAGGTGGIESESTQHLLEDKLTLPGDSSFIIVTQSSKLLSSDPRYLQALSTALQPIRANPHVRAVLAPDDAPVQLAQRLHAGHEAVSIVILRDEFSIAASHYPDIRAQWKSPDLQAQFTGNLAFRSDLNHVLAHDLFISELLSLPLALLVLLLVFGSLTAAAVSVGVGVLAVVTGIAAITALSHVMDIAVYAINVSSLIGLGVAIDYSLFLVSRYRDELALGHSPQEALEIALQTAGRAVAFSGLAVGMGLGGLLFFNGSFLASMGLAAAIVVTLAVLFALTFLPALLTLLGPRIDAGRVKLPKMPMFQGNWRRIARTVMTHPLKFLIPALLFLIFLGTPFSRLTMAAADVRTLPHNVEARDAYEFLHQKFPDQTRTSILVAVQFPKLPSGPMLNKARLGALFDLHQKAAKLPGVRTVESIAGAGTSREEVQALADVPEEYLPEGYKKLRSLVVGDGVALLTLSTDAAPASEISRDIVRTLRTQRQVADGQLSIAGQTAHDLDVTTYVLDKARYALTFTLLMTCIVLFVLLRSIILPLKAVVLNLLSISASFGALVWIFQEGHLTTLLRFEPAPLDPTLPLLLACTVFGLSMDYEVLMLSRMREEFLKTHNNTWSVAEGLEHTGKLVTSAAAIMIAVFVSFALARIVVVKAMGVGLAVAVALDASLVRTLLVPATMRLFGKWNWWAPKWLGGKPLMASHDEDHVATHDQEERA